MTFEQQWIEYDYNPFIHFSSNGKIISLNAEAQFLLGSATSKEIFELATTYASVSFGFKTTFLELEFGRYKFFALTVGYENENEIAIKLYQAPTLKINNQKPTGALTNIYTLVDLCVSSNSIGSNIKFTKEFDPTIPEIIINSDEFIKTLNKIYNCFLHNTLIHTKIFFRVGEHIKFDEKKYSIFSISVSAQDIDKQKAKELEILVSSGDFYVEVKNDITINIPMITS